MSRFGEIQAGIGVRQADVLLRTVVERIQSTLTAHEQLARTGSDEFAVLIRGGDADQVRACCRRIERVLVEPIRHADIALWVQVRFGAALAPENGEEPEFLTQP